MKTPPHAPNCPCFTINALNDKVHSFKMPDGGNWYIETDEQPHGYWRHIWAALQYKAWMMEAGALRSAIYERQHVFNADVRYLQTRDWTPEHRKEASEIKAMEETEQSHLANAAAWLIWEGEEQ